MKHFLSVNRNTNPSVRFFTDKGVFIFAHGASFTSPPSIGQNAHEMNWKIDSRSYPMHRVLLLLCPLFLSKPGHPVVNLRRLIRTSYNSTPSLDLLF